MGISNRKNRKEKKRKLAKKNDKNRVKAPIDIKVFNWGLEMAELLVHSATPPNAVHFALTELEDCFNETGDPFIKLLYQFGNFLWKSVPAIPYTDSFKPYFGFFRQRHKVQWYHFFSLYIAVANNASDPLLAEFKTTTKNLFDEYHMNYTYKEILSSPTMGLCFYYLTTEKLKIEDMPDFWNYFKDYLRMNTNCSSNTETKILKNLKTVFKLKTPSPKRAKKSIMLFDHTIEILVRSITSKQELAAIMVFLRSFLQQKLSKQNFHDPIWQQYPNIYRWVISKTKTDYDKEYKESLLDIKLSNNGGNPINCLHILENELATKELDYRQNVELASIKYRLTYTLGQQQQPYATSLLIKIHQQSCALAELFLTGVPKSEQVFSQNSYMAFLDYYLSQILNTWDFNRHQRLLKRLYHKTPTDYRLAIINQLYDHSRDQDEHSFSNVSPKFFYQMFTTHKKAQNKIFLDRFFFALPLSSQTEIVTHALGRITYTKASDRDISHTWNIWKKWFLLSEGFSNYLSMTGQSFVNVEIMFYYLLANLENDNLELNLSFEILERILTWGCKAAEKSFFFNQALKKDLLTKYIKKNKQLTKKKLRDLINKTDELFDILDSRNRQNAFNDFMDDEFDGDFDEEFDDKPSIDEAELEEMAMQIARSFARRKSF